MAVQSIVARTNVFRKTPAYEAAKARIEATTAERYRDALNKARGPRRLWIRWRMWWAVRREIRRYLDRALFMQQEKR